MHKIILCLLAFSIFTCGYAQSEHFQLENQLPDRTLLVWRFPDIAKSREAMVDTSLHQLFSEPEVQNFLRETIDPYKDYIEEAVGQAGGVLQMPLEDAINLITGELAVALVDVNLQRQSVGAVISVGYSDETQMTQLLELVKQNIGLPFAAEQYGNYNIYTTNAMGPDLTISYAFVNNSLVLASQKSLLQEMISGPDGLNKKLVDTEAYQKVKSKVHRHGVPAESVFINFEEAQKRFSFAIPEEAMGLINQLQVFNAKAWGLGINIDGNYINIDSFLYCPEKEGVWSFFDGTPLSAEIAANAPKHSNGFMALQFDMNGQLNNLKALLEDLAPDGSAIRAYEQAQREIERELGFSIDQELLELFDTEMYSFNYMPTEGGLLPRGISAISLKNTEKFWQLLENLTSKFGMEIKSTSFGDNTIYYFSQNLGNIHGDPFRNIERFAESIGGFSGLGFVLENNVMYMGGTVHDLKDFLEVRNSWEGFDQNMNFQELAKYLPTNASIVWYFDLSEFFVEIWNTFTPFLRSFEGIMRKAGIPFDSALLPQATTISKHLKPALFSYGADNNGFHMTYTSSMTFFLPVVGTIGVGSAIMVPIIEKQQKQAIESMAIANLRTIMTCQELYRMDMGRYGTLGELSDSGYIYSYYKDSGDLYVSYSDDYYYYIYFSGESTAMTETQFLESGTNPDRFIIYAIPSSYGKADKLYAMNQYGEVVAVSGGGGYSQWYLPEANAAFSEHAENAENLEGDMAVDAVGKDGNYWEAAY